MNAAADSPTYGFIHGVEMVRFGNIFGVGPGCYSLARGHYFNYTFQSHMLYGELIGDLGVLGTIAWFAFIRNIFRNANGCLEKLKDKAFAGVEDNLFLTKVVTGLKISLIVRLFIGLASHSLYIFYWYFLAALFIVIRDIVETEMEESGKKEKEAFPDETGRPLEMVP